MKSGAGDTPGGLYWFASLAVIVFIADQVSKAIVVGAIPYGTYHTGAAAGDPIAVIPGFFYLVHIVNRGAAWGMLDGMTFVLGLAGVAALLAMFFFRRALELHRPLVGFCLGMAAGGVAGNVVDRLFRGGVVDFLDVHLPAVSAIGFPGYRWPAFNIADSGITTGVILYLIISFFARTDERAPA